MMRSCGRRSARSDRRGARHRNRRADCGLCGGHLHAADHDIHEGTGALPSRVPQRSNTRSSRVGFSRARRRVAQFAAPDGDGSARKGRPHRFLDLHLFRLRPLRRSRVESRAECGIGLLEGAADGRRVRQGIEQDEIVDRAVVARRCDPHAGLRQLARILRLRRAARRSRRR